VALLDVLDHIHDIFVEARKCRGCEARDLHIESLREECHRRDEIINSLRELISGELSTKDELIDYFSGKTRASQAIPQPGTMHSIPRSSGIRGKIARAEAVDREEATAITAQRRREYDERIAKLERPETEIVENG